MSNEVNENENIRQNRTAGSGSGLIESSAGRERTNKKEKDELCHLKIGIFVRLMATSLTIRLGIGVQSNVLYFETEEIKYDEVN